MMINLKILHVVPSIDLSAGGPSKSVSDLALYQAKNGINVTIITNSSKSPYIKESLHPCLFLKFVIQGSFKKELEFILKSEKFDILHGHGIWEMPVHHMAYLARKNNIPYVISPRGMLEPWALNAGKLKKFLALKFYQKNDLEKANFIHATAKMEAENILKLGFTSPIAVIPNGIDISEFPLPEIKLDSDKNIVLFLSRIHPKKGIEFLIEAWNQIDLQLRKDWKVEIAGNGEDDYIDSLNKLIISKGLKNEIFIIGPQFGEAKLESYHRANLFILPTFSENFGIVVAEALACGVPVITTKGTPWEELNTFNAGWWVEIGVQPLVEALLKSLTLSTEERQNMGLRGRRLVNDNYDIEAIAFKMIKLYNWILTEGEKPGFVYGES
jgi:glycosyltransferase involved in cell wall biosynthesis